ncbi:SDR family NAD(P)-dependent oxidoreductase [Gordonia soli]|uniref:Putative oxidoreductase n=1 Tax=Gordonia soli NBRC 108243 TaxID=1223545 RepID=M0QIV7_9ACTN|nr:SDR family NAD(P)-dependent oxidoreductase [Gordonia soli]GAC68236.1 putative oxidoreductase [Gordonia soli NBRC 108243]
MQRPIDGLTVAITGGGRGIGRATAEAFHRRGATVVIGDVEPGLAAATAAEIGDRALGVDLDVTDVDSFRAFLGAAGQPDVVINNAGIMPTGYFVDETESMTRRMLDVNLSAVITGSRLALEVMVPRAGGHIINVASLAGEFAIPALATYGATKTAVTRFTEVLDLELRGTGVTVTAVLPGMIDTELSAGANYPRLIAALVAGRPAHVADAMVEAVASARGGVIAVPRRAGVAITALSFLPRRTRLAIEERAGLSSAFAHADPVRRANYHERIASRGETAADDR